MTLKQVSLFWFLSFCVWLHECQTQLKAHKASTRHLPLQHLDHANSCRLLRTQELCGWVHRVGQSQAEESVPSRLERRASSALAVDDDDEGDDQQSVIF